MLLFHLPNQTKQSKIWPEYRDAIPGFRSSCLGVNLKLKIKFKKPIDIQENVFDFS